MDIKPAQFYRHYKGDTYKIISLAKHTETQEWLVVYERQTDIHSTGERVWARPLSMFVENIDTEGYTGPRFEYIEG